MLRYALRRVLWSIPTLLATSFVLFFVTTLAPDPTARHRGRAVEAEASADDVQVVDRERRARFLDLPRFVNVFPLDVRVRVDRALAGIVAGGDDGRLASRELVRLGGAALPFVLPRLGALDADARQRLTVALAPLAERMGVANGRDLAQAENATRFWTTFWEDRALDFTRAVVSRTVSRLVEHGSNSREQEIVAVDTFALPALIRAMLLASDSFTLARLTRIAAHAAQRGPILDPAATAATADEARRAVADWSEWWFVYGSDFEVLDAPERVIAIVTNTQYGKWLKRIASGELGVSVIDGEPIARKLAAAAPVTLLICGLAMLVSFALAVPLGVLAAWRRGHPFDVVTTIVLFVAYCTPTFAVAEILRQAVPARSLGPRTTDAALAIAALAVGSLATLSRWQRTAMLDVLGLDFVRTARAKGIAEWRVLVVHALRSALLPTVTVAGLHFPTLLGGALVVEEVFGLRGIGFETMRAIEAHDGAWLMAVLLSTAFAVTVGLIVSDVAHGVLDPRVRELLAARQGRPVP